VVAEVEPVVEAVVVPVVVGAEVQLTVSYPGEIPVGTQVPTKVPLTGPGLVVLPTQPGPTQEVPPGTPLLQVDIELAFPAFGGNGMQVERTLHPID